MIVAMKPASSEADINLVRKIHKKHCLSDHPSQGVERTVIGVLGAVGPSGAPGGIGGINPSLGESLEGLPNVDSVIRVSKPYKLASREFHPADTIIDVPTPCVKEGVISIGSKNVVMMAGPCTVESEKQLMT